MLSEFARTLLTDFPIQAILERLVQRIVEVLPVSAAGVTLTSPGIHARYVAASNESALLFEQLQTEIGEGPGLAAYQTGEALAVRDPAAETRFPKFGPAALPAGLVTVFTFRLRNGDAQLGAVDLYRDAMGPLDAATMTRWSAVGVAARATRSRRHGSMVTLMASPRATRSNASIARPSSRRWVIRSRTGTVPPPMSESALRLCVGLEPLAPTMVSSR